MSWFDTVEDITNEPTERISALRTGRQQTEADTPRRRAASFAESAQDGLEVHKSALRPRGRMVELARRSSLSEFHPESDAYPVSEVNEYVRTPMQSSTINSSLSPPRRRRDGAAMVEADAGNLSAQFDAPTMSRMSERGGVFEATFPPPLPAARPATSPALSGTSGVLMAVEMNSRSGSGFEARIEGIPARDAQDRLTRRRELLQLLEHQHRRQREEATEGAGAPAHADRWTAAGGVASIRMSSTYESSISPPRGATLEAQQPPDHARPLQTSPPTITRGNVRALRRGFAPASISGDPFARLFAATATFAAQVDDLAGGRGEGHTDVAQGVVDEDEDEADEELWNMVEEEMPGLLSRESRDRRRQLLQQLLPRKRLGGAEAAKADECGGSSIVSFPAAASLDVAPVQTAGLEAARGWQVEWMGPDDGRREDLQGASETQRPPTGSRPATAPGDCYPRARSEHVEEASKHVVEGLLIDLLASPPPPLAASPLLVVADPPPPPPHIPPLGPLPPTLIEQTEEVPLGSEAGVEHDDRQGEEECVEDREARAVAKRAVESGLRSMLRIEGASNEAKEERVEAAAEEASVVMAAELARVEAATEAVSVEAEPREPADVNASASIPQPAPLKTPCAPAEPRAPSSSISPKLAALIQGAVARAKESNSRSAQLIAAATATPQAATTATPTCARAPGAAATIRGEPSSQADSVETRAVPAKSSPLAPLSPPAGLAAQARALMGQRRSQLSLELSRLGTGKIATPRGSSIAAAANSAAHPAILRAVSGRNDNGSRSGQGGAGPSTTATRGYGDGDGAGSPDTVVARLSPSLASLKPLPVALTAKGGSRSAAPSPPQKDFHSMPCQDGHVTPTASSTKRTSSSSPPPSTLVAGRYTFEGSNVDTVHMHVYKLSGICTLEADGSICDGTATEESAVWKTPVSYLLANGRWAPSGELSFLLVHADERSKWFDPFYFELVVAPKTHGGGGRRSSGAKAEDHNRQPCWEATSGWWNTAGEDTSNRHEGSAGGQAARPGTSCADRLWPSAPHGSFGRILEMKLLRSDDD